MAPIDSKVQRDREVRMITTIINECIDDIRNTKSKGWRNSQINELVIQIQALAYLAKRPAVLMQMAPPRMPAPVVFLLGAAIMFAPAFFLGQAS